VDQCHLVRDRLTYFGLDVSHLGAIQKRGPLRDISRFGPVAGTGNIVSGGLGPKDCLKQYKSSDAEATGALQAVNRQMAQGRENPRLPGLVGSACNVT
jgi:hypothetical protein